MRKVVGSLSIAVAMVLFALAGVVFLANVLRALQAAANEGAFYALGTLTGGILMTLPPAWLGLRSFQKGRARFSAVEPM